MDRGRRARKVQVGGAAVSEWKMDLDLWVACASYDAKNRLHRQIGQWARFAHRKVKERAEWERGTMALRFIADDLK